MPVESTQTDLSRLDMPVVGAQPGTEQSYRLDMGNGGEDYGVGFVNSAARLTCKLMLLLPPPYSLYSNPAVKYAVRETRCRT